MDHIKENNSLSEFPVSFILWNVYYVMYGNIFETWINDDNQYVYIGVSNLLRENTVVD